MAIDSALLHVVVVGGRSRSGQVFRRHALAHSNFALTVLVREPIASLPGEKIVVVKDYFLVPGEVLKSADVVVNFVWVPQKASVNASETMNVGGPIQLAIQAKGSGVKQFVQINSLNIYGAAERVGRETLEAPLSNDARSKQAADRTLSELGSDTFTVTILRMPMHYGNGAGDKLLKLIVAMKRLGWFPAPKTRTYRSMVHVENLAASIAALIQHRAGGLHLAADREVFSLEELARIITVRTGKKVRIIHLPDFLFLPLKLFAKGIYRRLYQNSVIPAGEAVALPVYPKTLQSGLWDVVT